MAYDGINKTDACFIELNALGYRITGALTNLIEYGEKLPVYKISTQVYDDELPKNKFMVKTMWEHLVLNLHKLIEIHDSVLGKILKENNAIELEKCLATAWGPIKKQENNIKNYRNIIAHSKEIANNYVSFMDIDPDYYQTQTKIIVAANAAVFYISGIFENLTYLYTNSRQSFNQKIKKIKEWHPHDEIAIGKTEAIEIFKKTNKSLIKNGYTETHKMNYD